MIRLRTLGSIDLRAPDDRVLGAVLSQPKRVAFLVYLVAARPSGFHRRDRLVALFWPELDDARARDALSQTLRFLRNALGTDVLTTRGTDEVGVDRTRLWCDAVAFREALDSGRPDEGLRLYEGDFLDGFFAGEAAGFEGWVESERSALRALAAHGARQLAEQSDNKGAHTGAVAFGRRAVELAPDDERAFRRWLGWLNRGGDYAGALQAYADFAHRLRTEYGAEPAPETKAMVEAIRRGSGGSPVALAASPESPLLSPVTHTGRREADVEKPAEPLGVGARLSNGRYVIEGVLGQGGMATVYLAGDVRHERKVAVKVLSSEVATGVGGKSFLREIRIAASLQHPHIVPLFDSGESDGQVFYVMPYIAGESVRSRLERDPPMPIEVAVRVARDMADALAYAHGRGIVHRDIKPDNVLLSGDPTTGELHGLVADFGVAKALDTSRAKVGGMGDGTLTSLGGIVGTPRYMAPEQASGGVVDCRADLYAWGVVAYEMLAHAHPFEGRTTARQLIGAHLTTTPESLSARRPELPPALATLVMQCLEKEPAARPKDGGELLAAFSNPTFPSGLLAAARRLRPSRMSRVAARLGAGVAVVRALALWSAAFVGVAGAAWSAVRWLPVPDWTFPAAILVMLAGLPVLALTAWLQRPAATIASPPTASSATTVRRIEAMARAHLTWHRAAHGGVLAMVVLAVLAAAWGASRALGIGPAASLRAAGVMGPTDRIFVADFEPPVSDSGLGDVVTDLLLTEIGRSASIPLVEPNERALALAALGLPSASRIRQERAREFASRANAKVYLDGAITGVGHGFLLRATLHKTDDDAALERFRQHAGSADEIIPAVDRLGRQVRERLGAALSEVRGAPELLWSATPSLTAARLYTASMKLVVETDDQKAALRLLERAVKEDSQFAQAYRKMAAYYTNVGNLERAVWAAERAFRLREKFPRYIRLLVEGTYYSQPIPDWDPDKSIAAYEAAAETELPGSTTARNNLGLAYRGRRDFERALSVFRDAVKVDTVSSFAPVSLTTVLWATGRKDEARKYVAENLKRWLPSTPTLVAQTARLASADLFVDSATAILDRGVRTKLRGGKNARAQVHALLSEAERTRGRLAIAQQHQDSVRILNPSADTVGKVPLSVLYRANVMMWDLQTPAEARRLLDSVARAHPPGNASSLAYRWLELAQTFARAGNPGGARKLLAAFEQRANAGHRGRIRGQLDLTHGEIALAESRYSDAISAFRAADRGFCTICALAPLARTYDLAGNADSAIAVLERYLTMDYFLRSEIDQTWLAWTYKRLGELHDAKGNVEKARTYYARFVHLWKNADPSLQPKVTEVRKRLTALRSSDSAPPRVDRSGRTRRGP